MSFYINLVTMKTMTSFFMTSYCLSLGFPSGSDGKESACTAGDQFRTLGQEDSLEKGKANPF